MKKSILIAAAVVACVVLGSISMAAAKPGGKTSVSSKVSLSYTDPGSDPYGTSGFNGKVRAKKGCSVKRQVKIKGVGKAKTSSSGEFSISSNSAVSGTYVAKVHKSTVTMGKQTIICKAADSKAITVP